jgi:hypothetical protein
MNKDTFTAGAAFVAAIAGIFNLWWNVKDRSDRILVRSGSYRPLATRTVDMYIVNIGTHPVVLKDYGFIHEDGDLFSLPWYDETEAFMDGEDADDYYQGSTTIEPRGMFTRGVVYAPKVIGVYAYTTTQRFKQVDMNLSRLHPKIFWIWFRAKFFNSY